MKENIQALNRASHYNMEVQSALTEQPKKKRQVSFNLTDDHSAPLRNPTGKHSGRKAQKKFMAPTSANKGLNDSQMSYGTDYTRFNAVPKQQFVKPVIPNQLRKSSKSKEREPKEEEA